MKTVLAANDYPLNFLESCIRTYLQRRFSPAKEPAFGPDKKDLTVCLPYCGTNSDRVRRQLKRLYSAVAPFVNIRIIFKSVNKLSKLSRLKSCFSIFQESNVVYKVSCKNCSAFYVGMTRRQLSQRLHEHKSKDCSALYKHSEETKHEIDFGNPVILDKDIIKTRLLIKETLHIQDTGASKSLNRNVGSFDLKLW